MRAAGVTSGGVAGTSGDTVRRRLGYGFAALVLVLIGTINALTVAYDSAEAGRSLDWWEPWLWEFSSTAYWVAMLPLFGWLASTVRPPRLRWPAAIAAHALLTLPVAAGHVATLFVVRNLVYRLLGQRYDYGLEAAHLLYEYRKDVLAYVVLVAAAGVIGHWARAATPAPALPAATNPAPGFQLEVRDGSRTHWLAPDEITWIEAAGNYVELHTGRGPVLHRATLAGVADVLAPHGFVRVHRSRLVRLTAVRSIESTAAGDFELLLADGARITGSRRYRAALQPAASPALPQSG